MTLKGEQVSTWSYEGTNPGSCGEPRRGAGERRFEFRMPPTRIVAARAGGRGPWGFALAATATATGRTTGWLTIFASQPKNAVCTPHPDESLPAAGCGDGTWTIGINANYHMHHPANEIVVGGYNLGGGPAQCPFFTGPANGAWADQGATAKLPMPSRDLTGGLRASAANVGERPFSRRGGWSVSRRLVKLYADTDQWGRFKAETTIRWTLTARPVSGRR